jgi:hypothetical protein
MNLAPYILVPFAISLLCIYFIGRYCADAQELPYTFKSSDKRAAFERWHDHQVEQLGASSNTLFVLASAGLGYSLALLSGSNQSLAENNTGSILLFTCAFAVSFLLGFLSIFNRLEDFRKTKQRHRLRDESPDDAELMTMYRTTRRIGAWTWGLLYAQGLFFFSVVPPSCISGSPTMARNLESKQRSNKGMNQTGKTMRFSVNALQA